MDKVYSMIGSMTASRKALWIIVGGFSIVLAANSALIYFALGTWTGLETEQHFVKGLDYNRDLEGARRQQALGWRMALKTTFDDPESGRIGINFSDRDGKPLRGLDVKVFAVRPTHTGYDREFKVAAVADGAYQSPFSLPLRGIWDLRVVARRGADDFQRVERIVTPAIK